MKICFPVQENLGLASQVFGHFGSAPLFVVVNTESNVLTTIHNRDQIHQHGGCNPLAGLSGETVDAIVVGGIGGGALAKLNHAGMRVFQAQAGTIEQNMKLLHSKNLPEFMPGHSCGGHGTGHSCSH